MAKLHEDDKEFSHESYGLVGFSRVSGNPGRLFGSSLDRAHSFIKLRVHRAKRRHSLGRDWYHSEGIEIIELDLSAAQFAELLTNMNVGDGVPCTLRRVHGRHMEDPPDELLESEQVRTDFKEKCETTARKMNESVSKIEEILEKKTISQSDRREILSRLAMVVQDVRSNMPFWLKSFHEATERITTAAKAEVDAFMTHAVIAAGWKALNEKNQTPALPASEKPDE